MTPDDHIRLALPADAEYGRIARIAAAGLALRMGFSYREIEDLRLAVDEALILLLRPDHADGVLTLEFAPTTDLLVIDLDAGADGGSPPDEASRARFADIVGDVVDRYELADDGHRVRLVKSHARVD